MKGKILLLSLCAAACAGAAAAPGAVRAAIPRADYVRAALRPYAEQANCAGVVVLPSKREVFIDTPVVAESVTVAPGDRVQAGETLAVIDTGATRSVLSSAVMVERSAGLPAADIDLGAVEAAAALYGVPIDDLLPALSQPDALAGLQKVYEQQRETLAVPERVVAPISGVVTEVAMQGGVLTQAQGAVFTVADDTRVAVRAEMVESRVAQFAPGDRAVVTGAAFEGREYHGVVTQLAPTAKRAANAQATVEITIDLLDPDELLRENYSATAQIISQHSEMLLSLPYEAVEQGADNVESVWVYADGRVQRRAVTTGREFTNCVEILSGVGAQDVVLLGGPGLREGGRVRLGEERLG